MEYTETAAVSDCESVFTSGSNTMNWKSPIVRTILTARTRKPNPYNDEVFDESGNQDESKDMVFLRECDT